MTFNLTLTSQPSSAAVSNGTQRLPAAMTYLIIAICLAISSWGSQVSAQANPEATTVVARVNGTAIYMMDVQQQLAQALRGRQAKPNVLRLLQAQAIEQLIGRQLILEMLTEKKVAANDARIELELNRIRKQLAVTGVTLEEHLKQTKQDLPLMRRTLRWQLSWQRYLDRYLNEENLQKYYAEHRPHFDGSQVRAAHILWKVDVDNEQARTAATKKAEQVAAKIAAGEMSFDAAARKHSAAPTAQSGGKIGFISRHDSMPESFAAATFDLSEGEVSSPIVTPFGVHLIRSLEVKPGQLPWHEVRQTVQLSATKYLFNWIVSQRRDNAKVEYTKAMPHFKPGTRQVVQ